MRTRKISIILCTYNGEAYLREQIDSLLAQTYPFYELIVQDDCSTDGTGHIVHTYREQYPDRNIRFHANPRRLGFNRNFLTALQRATGEYIACCDQDDIWLPDKLETLMREIGDSPLIFHNSYVMDGSPKPRLLYATPLPTSFPPLCAILYPRAYGHQMLFRQEVRGGLKPFMDYNVSYDYLLFTLAGGMGRVRYLHTPLVRWRRHEEAATYRGNAPKTSKWSGYLQAIRALWKADNRRRTALYFSLLGQVPLQDANAGQAVRLMAKGSLWGILSACLLCLRHRQEAVPGVQGAVQCLRAFFLPLAFIRDHGRYIINPLRP